MAYVDRGMIFLYVVYLMKYLGYTTHHEDGTLTNATEATAKALTGQSSGSMVVSTIATEYAKHNPRFMRGTVSSTGATQ